MSARSLEHIPSPAGVNSTSPQSGARERLFALAFAWWPYAAIVALSLIARLRYAVFSYHDSFSSGDAHLVLTRAMFVREGIWEPEGSLGAAGALFSSPFLLAFMYAGFSHATGLGVDVAPLILGPIITTAGLLAFYAVLRRAFDPIVAAVAVGLVALIPRFALDSTEPDKVAYVVSFWLIALYFQYRAQEQPRAYLASGVFMGLAVMTHTTAYLFVPVYVLSHIALTRSSRLPPMNWSFAVALVIVGACIATFVVVEDRMKPAPATVIATRPADPAPGAAPAVVSGEPAADAPPQTRNADDARFVPDSIEEYWDTLTGLAENGFRDSAWDQYNDGIRKQITLPAYVLAIAGFGIAIGMAVRSRRWEIAPIVLWMSLITVGFAIQYPAPSHGTRYPSYVTPVFVALAAAGLVVSARWVASLAATENRAAIAAIVAAPVLAFIGMQYATADDVQQRELYAPHRSVGDYVQSERLLEDGSGIVYLGWPSTTFFLLNGEEEHRSQLRAFGWGFARPERISWRSLEDRNVRYFIDDHTAADYQNSAPVMRVWLEAGFDLRAIQTFCDTDGNRPGLARCGNAYVVLYEMTRKQ
jgi:hypothetical protein